ncbi:MAG TPA: SulP family inorganic anion transporter [Hyphomicrobiaceae bacterium]
MSSVAFVKSLLSGLIIGLTAIVFSISFTAIIYTGELAPFLSRGIGLTLAGAAVMAVAGAFTLSYRGIIVQPQDVTALILSLAAASIAGNWQGAASDDLFATIAALVAVATATTGVAMVVFGRLRLGHIVRFIPYPVLGGFLAATGYLLVTGAIGMTIGDTVSVRSANVLFDAGNPQKWAPWIVAAVLFYVAVKRVRHGLVLPACFVAAVLCFYGALKLFGIDQATAQTRGLLLGPFGEATLYASLDPGLLVRARWDVVAAQLPSILAVIGMATIGSLLNVSGLELATGEDIDPNRELHGVGVANLAASAVGGMVGYHLLSQTLFAKALGVTGRAAGISVALVTLAVLFLGTTYLSVLPIGVFAAVIAFLGIDLLVTWLWVERRRLQLRDFFVIVLILAVAATIGFLEAIAIGILAASTLFIVAYSRVDVVRLKTTGARKRSGVERGQRDLAILSDRGDQVAIYELSGYLFFGTAHRLVSEISEDTVAQSKEFVLVDFKRVQGIDASAAFALRRLVQLCAAGSVTLIFCGLSDRLSQTLDRAGIPSEPSPPLLFKHLDDALQIVEEKLLLDNAGREGIESDTGLLDELRRIARPLDPLGLFEVYDIGKGEVVIEQGSEADDILLLVSGVLRVEYLRADGSKIPVAKILPGAVVGEIGFYAGERRTAQVIAEQDCRLMKISKRTLADLEESQPGLVSNVHRIAATNLALRLTRAMALLRDADV